MAWLKALRRNMEPKAEDWSQIECAYRCCTGWVDKAKTFGETAIPASVVAQPPTVSMIRPACGSAILNSGEAEACWKDETPESSAASEPSDWLSGLLIKMLFRQDFK